MAKLGILAAVILAAAGVSLRGGVGRRRRPDRGFRCNRQLPRPRRAPTVGALFSRTAS